MYNVVEIVKHVQIMEPENVMNVIQDSIYIPKMIKELKFKILVFFVTQLMVFNIVNYVKNLKDKS